MAKPIHWRKRRRFNMMLWAMLNHGMRHPHNRNYLAWCYLLEWARLGGKPGEAPVVGLDGVRSHG